MPIDPPAVTTSPHSVPVVLRGSYVSSNPTTNSCNPTNPTTHTDSTTTAASTTNAFLSLYGNPLQNYLAAVKANPLQNYLAAANAIYSPGMNANPPAAVSPTITNQVGGWSNNVTTTPTNTMVPAAAPATTNQPAGCCCRNKTRGCSERVRIILCGLSLLVDILLSLYLFFLEHKPSDETTNGTDTTGVDNSSSSPSNISLLFLFTAALNLYFLYLDLKLACQSFRSAAATNNNNDALASIFWQLTAQSVSGLSIMFTEGPETLVAIAYLWKCGYNLILWIKLIKNIVHVILESWEFLLDPLYRKIMLYYVILFAIIGYFWVSNISGFLDICYFIAAFGGPSDL